ncbi:MAG: peptide deformylase [Helicobacteraceae bacterium]|nr:peptide deformylase [Helicobacteraceae bacterium]
MIRPVLLYPDKRLRRKSTEITRFDEKLGELLDDMHDTMIDKKGVGIAAVQVGAPLRAITINIPDENGEQPLENRVEIINPTMFLCSGGVLWNEGCLSIPDFNEEIMRFERVGVTFIDRNGKERRLEAEGLLAIAIQHEIDHLNGKLFVEYLSLLKRKKFEKEWKKSRKN